MISDTIAAIATSTAGVGAISIIRISGPDAFSIANTIFKGKDLTSQPTHTIHYGHVIDPATSSVIDEVLVMLMRGPRSFTAEDVVEINCHGGAFVTKKILELALTYGARLAHPGEFSKRAFLNGRINLSDAEAIMDVIEAKSNHALTQAVGALDGKVSGLIQSFRNKILDIIATIEVNIDYPEYDDVEVMTDEILLPKTTALKKEMEQLLETAKTGQILKNGIRTAIIGRPNVGKSSLLNKLLREEKAIVTNIAGTTRDIVEGHVNIGGLTLDLIDTAGIRNTDDTVEAIGVEKSKSMIKEADLVLLVINANEPLSEEDKALLDMTASKNRIILLNKTDLPIVVNTDEIGNYIATSMVGDATTDHIEQAIKGLFEIKEVTNNETYITNTRHVAKITQSLASINSAIEQMSIGMPIDMVEMDLKLSWEILGEILGEDVSDSLIDELFTKFCLGK